MAHVGGKMVVMCGGLPSAGEARLKHRENPRNLGTDREHLLLKAEDPWYQVKTAVVSFVPFAPLRLTYGIWTVRTYVT